MKGIGRKINFGFGVLIALLLFSRALSLSELQRLERHDYEELVKVQRHSAELQRMLIAAARNDTSIVVPLQPVPHMTEEHIDEHIRRVMMPGVVMLLVTVAVILVFMFMVNFYYVRPTLLIQSRLDAYLRHDIPFDAPVGGRDEVARLKENIESLLSMQKSKKA